jgi:hypothetical protein
VAGICTSDVKAEELDSPLAGGGAGVVRVGGSVPTVGAAAAECVNCVICNTTIYVLATVQYTSVYTVTLKELMPLHSGKLHTGECITSPQCGGSLECRFRGCPWCSSICPGWMFAKVDREPMSRAEEAIIRNAQRRFGTGRPGGQPW